MMLWRTFAATAALSACLMLPASASGERNAPTLELHDGAFSLSLDVAEGRLFVFFPSDMTTGDRISGSMRAQPLGFSEADRERNRAQLERHILEIAGVEARFADRVFGLTVPVAQVALAFSVDGNVVSRGVIQVAPRGLQDAASPAPTMTQAGLPVSVHGNFDGDSSTTRATIGDQDCPILAESPRQVSFLAPLRPTGRAQLRIQEGANPSSFESSITNLDVRVLTARSSVARGHSRRLSLSVEGLQDLSAPMVVLLRASPAVRLHGGNEQITIGPSDASRAGSFQRAFNFSIVTPGLVDIQATLQTGVRRQYEYRNSDTPTDDADFLLIPERVTPP
jgi:hypothetical protein